MDWMKLLDELAAAGWSQTRIADRCGVGQATVSDLSRGIAAEPKFGFGDALRHLHKEVAEAAEATR